MVSIATLSAASTQTLSSKIIWPVKRVLKGACHQILSRHNLPKLPAGIQLKEGEGESKIHISTSGHETRTPL